MPLHHTAPSYLVDTCTSVSRTSGCHHLRSAIHHDLMALCTCLVQYWQCSFAISLPQTVCIYTSNFCKVQQNWTVCQSIQKASIAPAWWFNLRRCERRFVLLLVLCCIDCKRWCFCDNFLMFILFISIYLICHQLTSSVANKAYKILPDNWCRSSYESGRSMSV